MDYLKFIEELDMYNEWESKADMVFSDSPVDNYLSSDATQSVIGYYPDYPIDKTGGLHFYKTDLAKKGLQPSIDNGVDSPAHYTSGSQEVIETIEDVVKDAPDSVVGGLQWNTLKYLMRMWLKGNPKKDAMKAQWYLERLISKL